MKILVVQETDWIERGPHQQHHLFERLETMGHEIRVVDFEFLWSETGDDERYRGREIRSPDPQTVDDAKVTLVRPPIIKVPLLDKMSIPPAHWQELRKQFTEYRPDVVVGFGILNTYIAARMARAYDVPFVYYIIDHLHTLLSSRVFQTAAKQIETWTISRADYVYTINEGLREYAINLGTQSAHTRVIPGGVELDKYREGNREMVDLPTEIDRGDTVLFFMGWLYDFSGLKQVAQDLADADEYEDVRMLIVGEGDLYEELQTLKWEHLDDQLVLTGRVPFDEIPHYLDYADVCLLPAEHNNTMHDIVPIKMYEYLASGSPVVATRLPGLEKEFGEDSGVVYTGGPEEAFETVIDLLESEAYKYHTQQGLDVAKQHDWPRLARQFETHLESIAKEKTPSHREEYVAEKE